MNQEDSLELYAEGREAWNDWVERQLAVRSRLINAGEWGDNPITKNWYDEVAVDFTGHIFEGVANFINYQFLGNAVFKKAKFRGKARFLNTTFSRHTSFDRAEFISEAEFGGGDVHR